MRAFFWKEVRENWFVALVGSLVFGATLTVLVAGCWRADLLVDDDLAGGVILNAAFFGFVLGLLQAARDRVLGRWPFLVHRPASMRGIFLAKAAAGLCMYLAAMAVPFLALLVLAASSDSLYGPFFWGLSQPGLADILGGVPYYFAGFIAGTRDRRFQHGRIVGIALALAGTGWSFLAADFAQVLVGHLLCVVLAAMAAWGSFLRGGRTAPQPAASRVSLGFSYLLLSLGICVGGSCLVEAGCQAYDQWQRDRALRAGGNRIPSAVSRERTWETYVSDSEGRILRQITTYTPQEYTQRYEVVYGPPLKAGEEKEVKPFYEDTTVFLGRGFAAPLGSLGSFRRRDRWIVRLGSAEQEGTTTVHCWIPSQASVLAYRYTRLPDGEVRKRLAKSIDLSPYLPAGEGTPRWSGDGIFFTRRRVCELSWETGQVRTLYGGEKGDVADWKIGDPMAIASGDQPPIVTETGLVFLPAAGREMKFVEHPRGVKPGDPWYIDVCRETARGERVVFYKPLSPGSGVWEGIRAMVIRPGPEPTALVGLPPLRFDSWDEGRSLHFPYGSSVPLLHAGIGWVSGLWGGWRQAFMKEVGAAGLSSFPASCAVALACAALGFWRGRRFAFGPAAQAGWAAANALLGVAGLLTMLFYCDWPARVPCPGCGGKRRVDRELCHACGAAFPKPPLDGTEILERSESQDATNFDASLRA